jgi:hypothetical protein
MLTGFFESGRGAGAIGLTASLADCGGRTTLAQFGQTPATPSNVTRVPQLGQTTVGINAVLAR